MNRMLCLLFVLCVYATENIHGRSLDKRSSESDSTVWIPDGMSLDDWYRCHGFPCDKWERTKEKLMMVKTLASQEDQDDLSVLDKMDEIIERFNISTDDDLDGCTWLTEEQLDAILEEKGVTNHGEGHSHMTKRQVHNGVATGGFAKWPMPVHYKFDGDHTPAEADYIRRAVAHMEEQTCIDFREIATDTPYHDNHIIVTRRSTGCHSYVGRIGLNGQQLNLQPGCIFAFGIPVHEFTHALGVWHEMQRWDRDDHVDVLWDNIGSYRSQFFKQSSSDLGTEYDPSSVMHYAGTDGAFSGTNSMETKNPLYQRNMGQRSGLSFRDAQLLNKVYCNDRCATPLPQSCERGGYQDPKDCSTCRCPPGFSGTYCQHLAPSNADCGGEYSLSTDGSPVTIQSPGYVSPGYYREFQHCNWRFEVPVGYKVSLEFVDEFGVYCGYSQACFHWVEVQYEAHKNTQGPRFCCDGSPDTPIVSEWNEMTVLFRSDYSSVSSYYRRGFRAVAHAVRDGQATPTPTQSTPAPSRTTPTAAPSTASPHTTMTTTTTTTTVPTTTVDMQNMDEECVPVDLSISLDSSGSVTNMNWQKLLRFSHNLLKRLSISPACSQVAMLSFGTNGYLHSRLDQHVTKPEIVDVIYRMPFRDEWTNTAGALEVMTTDVYVSANGDRSEATNVALIVTDGPSNRNQERTIPNAENARSQGVEILTIAVGSSVDEVELEGITGDPDRNVYVPDFDELMQQHFIQSVFNRIKEITNMDEIGGGEFSWSCSFELDNGNPTWCGINQASNDEFDWTLTNKATPSDPTGPDVAHSGSSYVFIEASGRRLGDRARLELPAVPSASSYCLSFAYHLYGWHIDTLYVAKQSISGGIQTLWSEHGNKGDVWFDQSLNLDLNRDESVVFIGQRGAEYSGDIGLDSIQLHSGRC